MISFLTNFGFAILQFIPSVWNYIQEWRRFKQPAGIVLDQLISNKQCLRIFVKDLIVPENTFTNPKLFSIEGNIQQANPNIEKVWPEVEGKGVGLLQNLLGQLGKKEKIEIVEMSKGYDLWDENFIILGAQAMKCREYYNIMDKVGYYMDEQAILDKDTQKPISMEKGYGYGLVIKAEKGALRTKKHTGILLGGFGTLGTAAAIYYFVNSVHKLGKEFGKKPFSLVVRARINSGPQSVTRISKLDKIF